MSSRYMVALAMAGVAMAAPAPTPCVTQLFDGCNPAHTACPNGPGTFVTVTPSTYPTSYLIGCNPAHSSCSNGPGQFVTISSAPSVCATVTSSAAITSPAVTTTTGPPASTGTPCTTQFFTGCNIAHTTCPNGPGTFYTVTPSSYPTSYFIGCNPAHTACPNGPGSFVTLTAEPERCFNGFVPIPGSTSPGATTPVPFPTPGPQTTPVQTTIPTAATNTPSAVSTVAAATETKAADLTWTVENLSRYCGEGNDGCDYNFNLTASDNRPLQSCTIIRLDVESASTESWTDQTCTSGSDYLVSWGYSAQFGVENAFAVMTVVNQKERAKAYFGIANINAQPVTPSNPEGSGQYGDITEPVYLF